MKKMIFLIVAIVATMTGCKTQYVPVEHWHTDTLRQVVTERDSIYMHDSVIVKTAGDTLLIEKWHTRYRDRWHTDTIHEVRRDSVPVPYKVEVIKEVEAPLSWWQQTRLHIANIALWAILILIAVWLIRLYSKYKK